MKLRPFSSLRPAPGIASRFTCPPYDVIDRESVRETIRQNPDSFLRITRSDGELPDHVDPHSPEVYQLSARNLRAFLDEGLLLREDGPCLYVYRQKRGNHSQTGVAGCVSVEDYRDQTIRVHEKTRPEKVRDRSDHMRATGLHAEPVFLAFRTNERISSLISEETDSEPLYDLTTEDGVSHTLWRIASPSPFVDAFADLPRVYIADGHHRAESAKQCADLLAAVPSAGDFPAVLFPHDELLILPYNRILRELPQPPGELLETLKDTFDIRPALSGNPSKAGEFCMFIGESWYLLAPRSPAVSRSPVEALDVSTLSRHILEPVFRIEDERTDRNIDFIGGVHGTAALEEAVRSGRAGCAFSLYPVTIDQLFTVADADLLMPPKSTWFEPKLRSGLFIHQFSETP